jgi:glyoxylase-like metal-dependent hydrolase (beta-lactamase superfamily II)
MQIIPLSEGSYTIDKTKAFIPFNIDEDHLISRPIGSLLVEIQPFVIITANDVILLDTGLGHTDKDGTLQLHNNLKKAGINPAQVTKVLASHLHRDHAGGITMEDAQSQQRFISFPYATYYVQRREFEFGLEGGSSSYTPDHFALLDEFSRVDWLTEDKGQIDGYIRYQLTGAHSKFHQVFWIEENGENVFFGGDVAPQLYQMKSRFVAKYDYDGKKCMELRQQWWQEGAKENWRFLFYHDIKSPVYPV